MKKKIVLIIVSSALLIASLLLCFRLINLINSKKTVVVSLNRENFIFPKDSNLKYFYEPKPGRVLRNKSRNTVNTITSESLNERFDYAVDKPKYTFRIVSLGDSWTYGYGVSTQDNYSEVLEDLLNKNMVCRNIKKFEVINLGAPGYDIEFAAERFRLRGQKYNPDLILWSIKSDDFAPEELVRGKETELATADNSLQGKNIASAEYLLAIKKHFLAAQREVITKLGEEALISREMKALDSMNYYKNGFLFMQDQLNAKQKSALGNFARGKSSVDVNYEARSLTEEELIPVDGHPNQKGHKALAQDIFNYLNQNKIIPCDPL